MLKPFTGRLVLNPDGRPRTVVQQLSDPPPPAQQAPVEAQGRSVGRIASDLGLGIASGAVGLAGDVAQGINTVSGGAVDRLIAPTERLVTGAPARGIAQLTQAGREAISARLSPDIQARQQNLQEQRGFVDPAVTLLSDPGLAGQFLAEQVPIIAALGKTARVSAKSGRAASVAKSEERIAQRPASAKAVERLAERAANKASQQSIVASSAVLGGGSAANQASQEVAALPIETLRENPEFTARAAIVGEDAARAELAQTAALRALAIAAPASALAGRIAAPFEAKLFRGQLGGGSIAQRARGVATGVAREFTEESLQEGSEQLAQNVGVQAADSTVETLRGVPEAASIGGVLGGLFGAAGGLGGGLVRSDVPAAVDTGTVTDPAAPQGLDQQALSVVQEQSATTASAPVSTAPTQEEVSRPASQPLEAAASIATSNDAAAITPDAGPASRAFVDAQAKEVAKGGDLFAEAARAQREVEKEQAAKATKKGVSASQSAQTDAASAKTTAPPAPLQPATVSATGGQTAQALPTTATAPVVPADAARPAQGQPATSSQSVEQQPRPSPLAVGEVRQAGKGTVTLTPIASDPIVAAEPRAKEFLSVLRAATSTAGGGVALTAQNNLDAPTGAIGGGGIRVNLRGPSVSATQIPTTTDVRQFGVNFVGPQAIESIVVAKGVRVLPAERKILADSFTSSVAPDGSTVYTPNAQTAAPPITPPAQQPQSGTVKNTPATRRAAREAKQAVSKPVQKPSSVADKTAEVILEPTNRTGRLPAELSKASPRFGFGDKQFELTFASDIDRAAFIGAQATPSKRDADFVRFAMEATGLSEAQVREHGAKVRSAIKELARNASPGRLVIKKQPIDASGSTQAGATGRAVKGSLTAQATIAKTPAKQAVSKPAKVAKLEAAQSQKPAQKTVADKVAEAVAAPQAPTRTEGSSIADPDVKSSPSNAGVLTSHIAPIISRWQGDVPAVRVVQSVNDLPAQALRGSEFKSAEGWYDGATIYLVADNIGTTARAEQVLAHEAFGHYGVDGVFGQAEWNGIVAQVNKLRSGEATLSAPLRSALESTRRRYPNANRETFARELIAVMAERNVRASPFGRVMAAVRAFLRALGINPASWAEADLRSVVSAGMRRVQNAQKARRATVSAIADGAFSIMDPNVAVNTLAEAMAPDVGIVKRLLNRVSDITPTALKALTLRQLTEIASDRLLPNAKRYQRTVDDMKVRRIQLQNAPAKVVRAFQELQSQAYAKMRREGKQFSDADVMADVAHDATIAGVDPAEAFVSGSVSLEHDGSKVSITRDAVDTAISRLQGIAEQQDTEPDRAAIIKSDIARLKSALKEEPRRESDYAALVKRFNAMPKAWQDMYRSVRDEYARRADETMASVLDRIERMELSDSVKKDAHIRARARFESARVTAPYFPLARFGEYWASLTSPEGEPHFIMAETKTERDAELSKLAAKGFKFNKAGVHLDSSFAVDQTSGTFVADVVSMLGKNGVDAKVQDEVYQMFLRHLPDLSARKAFIHRKKIAGYSSDMLRAFAGQMNHSAFQLARLEFNDRLSGAITKAKGDLQLAQARSADDGALAGRLLNELQERNNWVMHPTHNRHVQALQSFNFVFYLGLAPASALVNLTQNVLVTYPALAARYGVGPATRHLMSTMWQSIRTGGNIESTALSPDEDAAMNQLVLLGARDQTLGHDLAGLGDNDSRDFNPLGSKVMHFASSLFHRAEVVNRESSGLATYRLAREAGKSHDAAVLEATDTIYSTHFDFSNENRAAFMQGNAGKIIFAFKQYSQGMSYFLGRAAFQSFRGETPAIKAEARKRILGSLFMTGVFSGVLGMPTMSMMLWVANAMAAAFGDDDEPFDAETELRNFFVDMLGKPVGNAVSRGPIEALTGLGISQRTSLSELWFRDPDREMEGRALANHVMEQVAGPIGAIAINMMTASSTFHEGFETGNGQMMFRAVESMLPQAAKGAVRALRFGVDGAKTLRGDPLVDEVSFREVLFQFAGFSPSRINAIYDVNTARKNIETAVVKRRTTLIDAYALTLKFKDREGQRNIVAKIAKFNKANPGVAITMSTIRRAMTARQNFSERAVNGIVVNPRLQRKIDERVRF